MNIRGLFGFQGRVSRARYTIVGILAVLLKHNLDRFIAAKFLHVSWGIPNYFTPLGNWSANFSRSAVETNFLLILGVTALPFIWLGIAMTVKRLRDAGFAPSLVFFFFVPAINILFFLLLCILPSRETPEQARIGDVGYVRTLIPKSKWGSAAFSAITGSIFGFALGWFAISGLGNYGWTLFLAVPFFMGFLAVWLYSLEHPRNFTECISVAMLSISICGAIIVGAALDGIFCVAMAAPIAAALAFLGAYLAYAIQSMRRMVSQSGAVLGLFLAIPLMAGAEFLAPLPTPIFQTHTSIEIAASPQLVWKHMISFPRIETPLTTVFQLGIPHPIEAQITGSGLTADRQCIFSSGAFREPILAWEEGKHFAFGVAGEEPPLMKEWSPYGDIHVRHLDDHDFLPLRADFYLTELPDGRTRLDGWTTYQNKMWPAAYWKLWTDTILHQIHLRVFRQVKQLSEQDAALRVSNSSLR
jgi:uncharacterized membrane protein YhaH (DUF805 family)